MLCALLQSIAAAAALSAGAALLQASHADTRKDAPAGWLSEADLKALMLDKRMAGVYPEGTPWREIIKPDGSSDYWENGRTRPGRWWFDAEGFLCFNYPSTGTGGCFKYVKLTANCYEHFSRVRSDDDLDGQPGRRDGLVTNGRLWSDDKPSTCEAEPTV